MTTTRDALAALLKALPKCEGYSGNGCHRPASHVFDDGRRSCKPCADAQEHVDPEDGPIIAWANGVATAIEQSERALAVADPVVTIERLGRVIRVTLPGADPFMCGDEYAAAVETVAGALGAKVMKVTLAAMGAEEGSGG